MPLLDRFRSRPAWQSKDPEIRASAVRALAPDQQELLAAIAREDDDPRVRRLAVRKISDAPLLAAIAREDADAGVRAEASQILERQALEGDEAQALAALEALGDARHLVAAARGARQPEVRRAALARINDARSLAAVVRASEDSAIRQAALSAIDDAQVLAELALRSDHKDVAVHATERLSDRAALEAVAERARHKAAARRARALLDAAEPAPPPAEEAAPEAEAEPEAAELHEAAAAPPIEEPPVPTEPSPEEAIPEEAREDEPGPAEAVEAALASPEPAVASPPAVETEPTPEQRAQQEAWCAEAEAAAGSAEPREARAQVQALLERSRALGVLGQELAPRFEAALARAAAREQEARAAHDRQLAVNLARVQALADRLEKLVRAEALARREAEQALREARDVLDRPPSMPRSKEPRAVLQRIKAARSALYPRVQEMREADEWSRWANAAQQEELCKRVEALLQVEDMAEAARQLREIDERWKQVAQAPRGQAEALWRRFKAARDQVRARCHEHFARLAEQRTESIKRKQALCEQAEALADSTDWVRTAETLRKLQEEWKQSGPVPRRQGKALWERFRGACDRFFQRRKQDLDQRKHEWSANQAKKEALCARADELAQSSDWDAAAAEVKKLQAEWKTVGPVRKNRSQPLWDRFHGACDRFFERYKQRGSIERAARAATLEALCAELEGMASGPADDLAPRVQDVLARWRQAGGPAGDSPLAERRARAVAALVEAHPESFGGTELDPAANRTRMEKLCARVEALLSRPEASGSLAERLREALAANTMGAKGQTEARWREAEAEMEAVRSAWKKLGPVPGEAGEALRKRFQAACQRFAELRPHTLPRATR